MCLISTWFPHPDQIFTALRGENPSGLDRFVISVTGSWPVPMLAANSQHFSSECPQSAAAALADCCFIISSIPFFMSFAVGSALCVPTIQA